MPYLEKATLGDAGSPQVILYEGGTMGDLYINRELRTDLNGNIYVDPQTNKVELTTTERRKVASLLPKGNIGWSNSFAWKGAEPECDVRRPVWAVLSFRIPRRSSTTTAFRNVRRQPVRPAACG